MQIREKIFEHYFKENSFNPKIFIQMKVFFLAEYYLKSQRFKFQYTIMQIRYNKILI